MTDAIETDVEDLADAGVASFLFDLLGTARELSDVGAAWNRVCLKRIVRSLDRASPDWPQTVLGLPPVSIHGAA